MALLPVHGGPADGTRVPDPGSAFCWINAEGLVWVWAPGRKDPGLYSYRDGGLVYVGAGGWECDCGATVLEHREACPLCGWER